MKGDKQHRWVIPILVVLIKSHRKDQKLSLSGISARLNESGLYDDIAFEQREARINNILKWLSKHKRLSDIKSTEYFFGSKDEFSKIFNEKTVNLRVVRFGEIWGLE